MRPRTTLLGLSLLALAACGSPAAPPPATAVVVAAAPVVSAAAPVTPALVHVQVLALNDFHGNLAAPRGHDGSVLGANGERIPAGGAAYLAAHVRRLARANPNTVVVSAGDLTGASPLVSNLFHDEPTVKVMNRLGLAYEGVGNHDFDRGLAELRRLQMGGVFAGLATAASPSGLPPEPPFEGASFQYLAANVLGKDGKPVFPAYAVKDFGGVKVAFVGMTLEGTRTVTTKEAVHGLTFANEAATANALLPELRAKGVAATVILLHQGGFQDDGGSFDSCKGLKGDILPVVGALDPTFRVVVTAHTHQAYDCTLDGRTVTSAGSYGRLVTAIDLAIDPAKNELVSARAENVPVTRDITPDADVERLVAEYETKARPVTDRVVGYQVGALTRDPKGAHSPSCETPLGDVIADAQLEATRKSGAVLALMNPGGIRTDLAPLDVAGGAHPIRYGAAFEVQPFGNRLVTLTLTGAQLRGLLEEQFGRERPRVLSVSKGFTYRYAYDAAAKAVTIDASSVRLNGVPVEANRKYRVTVNSFLAEGGDGFTALRDAAGKTEGPLDIEALVDYLGRKASEQAPLAARPLERVLGNGCE